MNFDGLVDVGGYKLYVKSEGTGSPIIVFDAGYGGFSNAWDPILADLSSRTTTIVYDRAGLGSSQSSPHPRNSLEMIKDLKRLLTNLSIDEPIILVGHSFGGVNCLLYAHEYPEHVAGIVLVDSTPHDYISTFLPQMSSSFQEKYRNQFVTEGTYEDMYDSLEQLRNMPNHLEVPLVIIAAGNKEHYSSENQALWLQIQRNQMALSSRSTLVVAENSGHYVQRDEPEIVVKAIQDLVGEWHSCISID